MAALTFYMRTAERTIEEAVCKKSKQVVLEALLERFVSIEKCTASMAAKERTNIYITSIKKTEFPKHIRSLILFI